MFNMAELRRTWLFSLITVFKISSKFHQVIHASTMAIFKKTRSVTMNIFLFKLFVKTELSYVFTINMFSTAESCKEQ